MPGPQRGANNPWPTWPLIYRTSSAHEEGGERLFSVNTTSLVDAGSGAVGMLRAEGVEAGTVEGRPAFVPVPASTFELEVDLVLIAMGFLGPEVGTFVAELGLGLSRRGNIAVDKSFQTTVPGVFACGDMARGQSLIVWAIAEGRSAAASVDRYLTGRETCRRRSCRASWRSPEHAPGGLARSLPVAGVPDAGALSVSAGCEAWPHSPQQAVHRRPVALVESWRPVSESLQELLRPGTQGHPMRRGGTDAIHDAGKASFDPGHLPSRPAGPRKERGLDLRGRGLPARELLRGRCPCRAARGGARAARRRPRRTRRNLLPQSSRAPRGLLRGPGDGGRAPHLERAAVSRTSSPT